MSREIDERVVQMQFENGVFEKNIQTSIHSLNELKKGLDFEGSTKGLEKIDKAAQSVKMDALSAAVERLSSKFSLLGITAFNVMNRISNAAINTGETLIKSLSVDQIMAGFSKYEQKTSSVQTIMSATSKQFTDTGEQMAYVNEQLDKLNWFTDETSYNFVDMVSNIGKFTANNIPLKEAVTSMQGIANWAAMSGANAQQASHSMYNLAQALSTGRVQLIDWKSIELMNMGTAQFKEEAIEAAVAAGSLTRGLDGVARTAKGNAVTIESFRDSLQDGWFTTEALIDVLNKYGGAANRLNALYNETGIASSVLVDGIKAYTNGTMTAEEVSEDWGLELEKTKGILEEFSDETMQFGLKAFDAAQEARTFADAIDATKDAVSTGWLKSFELIFGDYTQAKELWTELSNQLYDIFAGGTEARNEMLKAWQDAGGRDTFVDTIWGGLSAILRILTPIKLAWNDVFGSLDTNKLLKFTEGLHDFVLALNLTEDQMSKLRRIFGGLFSILGIGKTAFLAMANAAQRVISYFIPLGSGALSVSASFGGFLKNLDETIQKTQVFDKIFGALADSIIFIANVIATALQKITGALDISADSFDFSELLIEVNNLVESGFNRLISIGDLVRNVFMQISGSVRDSIPDVSELSDSVKSLFKAFSSPFSVSGFKTLIDVANAGIFTVLVLNIKKFINGISKLKFANIVNGFTSILKSLKETIDDFALSIKVEMLRSIAVSIAILAASLLLLASIDSNKLTSSLGASIALFAELLVTMKLFDKLLSGGNFKSITRVSRIMIVLSVSITILAGAVKKLSDLEWGQITRGLIAIGTLSATLVISMRLLTKGASKVTKTAASLIAFSISIRILASAVKALSDMDLEGLIKGLASTGILMAEISAFLALTKSNIKMSTGVGLIALAASIQILTSSVESLSALTTDQILKGLVSLGVVLSELAIFTNAISGAKHIISTALAMNLLAASMNMLANVILKFDSVSAGAVALGLTAMAISLGEIIVAIRLLPKDIIGKSAGLFVIASGISVLSSALIEMGDISSVSKSLIALGGSLLIISLAMRAIKKTESSAVAMTIMAGALTILIAPLKTLGGMSLGEIAKSLLGLAGAFGIIGAAAVLLKPIIPAVKKLSVAIGTFSFSALALGVGVTLLSAGLAALGTSAAIGVGGLTVALLEIINMIPAFIEAIARGVILFAEAIAEGAPVVANAFVQLVLSSLHAISDVVPEIVDVVMEIIEKVIAAIGTRLPDMREAGKSLFDGFSEGVAISISEIVKSIALLIPSLVGSMKMLSGAKGMEKGAVSTLLSMIGVVAAIGLVLIAFSNIPMGDVDSAVNVAAGISILLPIISGCFALLSKTKSKLDKGAIGQFALMSAIAVAIGGLVSLVGMIPGVDNAIKVASSLAILLPSLATTIGIMSMVKGFNAGSLAKISQLAAAMDIVLVIVGGLVAGIGALANQFEGFGDALATAPKYTELLGQAIGNFIGALIGGIAGGALAGLASTWPVVCGALSLGMQQLKPFFDILQTIPGGGVELVGTLIGMILALTAAEFMSGLKALPGIGTLLAVGALTLPADFASLGAALKAFSDELGDVDVDRVTKAAEAVSVLSKLEVTLPAQGGLVSSWFLGTQSLDSFGERLKTFGSALTDFYESVKDIDPAVVTDAANAGSALSQLEQSLPATDSTIKKWFFGEKDLGAFGTRLKSFGDALSDFGGSVTGIEVEAIEAASTSGKILVELENSLSNVGGNVDRWFFGEKDLGAFGERLKTFGDGLSEFSNSVEGLDVSSITSVSNAVSVLVSLEKSIDTSGGLGSIFFGDSSFKSFGSNLVDLGNSLFDYSESIKDINTVKISSMNVLLTSLLGVAKQAISDSGGLASLGGNLRSFASNVDIYSTSAINANTDAMAKIKVAIEDLLRLSEFTDAQQWINDIVKAMVNMVNRVSATVTNYYPKMRDLGKNLAYWYIQGFKIGVDENLPIATDSAILLANKVDEAVRNTLLIASPSAVMAEEGKWVVRGLAEGITNDTSAEEAASKKAQNVVNAFQEVLSTISAKSQRADLEYQLWEQTEGYGASDADKNTKQLQVKTQQLQYSADQVKAQKATLEALKKTVGESSKEYNDAYNTYLQDMINMYEKKHEIDQITAVAEKDDRQKMIDYANTRKEYAEAFKMLGWSELEQQAFAMQKSGFGTGQEVGYTTEQLKQDLVDTNAIIAGALAEQSVSIEQSVTQTASNAVKRGLSKVTPVAQEAGQNVTQGFAEGIADQNVVGKVKEAVESEVGPGKAALDALWDYLDEHSPSKVTYQAGAFFTEGFANGIIDPAMVSQVNSASINVSDNSLNSLKSSLPQYEYIGRQAMTGFKNGIEIVGRQAIAAAQRIANEVAATMEVALAVHSPSRVTERIGKYVSLGLANGILAYEPQVANASEEIAKSTLSVLDETKGRIYDALQSDDFSMTITPVLNMDEVKQQAKGIPGLLGSGNTLQIGSIKARVGTIAADKNDFRQNGSIQPGATNFSFTQNNYSPKALSRIDIYRDTKNQFSQLKGMVNRR